MRGNWCKESDQRRHFAKKGRLYCNHHFQVKNDGTLQFLFQDVYARSLERLYREELLLTRQFTGIKSDYASDAYTIPVILRYKE